MDCVVNKMYPEIKVEAENKEYAYILLNDYAGEVSELSAITLYSYQQFLQFKDEEFAHIMEQISIAEMIHLKMLGQTIKLLGVNPIYKIKDVDDNYVSWNSEYVSYDTNIVDMLKTNIEKEKEAILKYQSHIKLINDKYIKELLARIIEDEEKHLGCFNKLLKQYT